MGASPRAEANSNSPTISPHSISAWSRPSPSRPRSGESRRRKASAKARTAGARSAEVRSPIRSSREAPAVISCLAQPLLQGVELRGDLGGQAVAERREELADRRDLGLPLLRVHGEDLLELALGHLEPLRVERPGGRHAP